MVRPFRSETARYGEYSKAGEFVYDHPFLWGSKRTGPDLAREGQINASAAWHYDHMWEPTNASPGSLMPRYPWLYTGKIDKGSTPDKISAMRTIGVPYEEGYEDQSVTDLEAQAERIAAEIEESPEYSNIDRDSEIIALIAYLKRLGTDILLEE